MLEYAIKMLICLLIAGLLGGIIGYILGRMRTCDDANDDAAAPLYDYDEIQQKNVTHTEVFAPMPDTLMKKTHKGTKPPSLSAPRNGIADDLKEISGIGLKVENTLYELGIFHIGQIAEWTHDNVIWIEDYLSNQGRVTREEWIGQAIQISRSHESYFKKKSD